MSLVCAVRQQSEKFNLVLDFLRQLLQPLRLALLRYLAFIYMTNFLALTLSMTSSFQFRL